jgi:hypothetical protein
MNESPLAGSVKTLPTTINQEEPYFSGRSQAIRSRTNQDIRNLLDDALEAVTVLALLRNDDGSPMSGKMLFHPVTRDISNAKGLDKRSGPVLQT